MRLTGTNWNVLGTLYSRNDWVRGLAPSSVQKLYRLGYVDIDRGLARITQSGKVAFEYHLSRR